VDITVVTTDGYNTVSDTISSVDIDTQCGLSSTTLTDPSMNTLTKSPYTKPVLTISGTVSSDNPTCPVTSHTMSQGSSDFSLEDDGETFTLAMTEDANKVETTYNYQVLTVASGGASATTSGSMVIAKQCVATLSGANLD
jgi:hypothetical protein